LSPDIYTYTFLADGMRALDPANSFIRFNLLDPDNQVHIINPGGE
jgi:hypothetical protein